MAWHLPHVCSALVAQKAQRSRELIQDMYTSTTEGPTLQRASTENVHERNSRRPNTSEGFVLFKRACHLTFVLFKRACHLTLTSAMPLPAAAGPTYNVMATAQKTVTRKKQKRTTPVVHVEEV